MPCRPGHRWLWLLHRRWAAMRHRRHRLRCAHGAGQSQPRQRQPAACRRQPRRPSAPACRGHGAWPLSGVPVPTRCASARVGSCRSIAWSSGRSFRKGSPLTGAMATSGIGHRAGVICTLHDVCLQESAVEAVGRLAEGARRVASRPEVAVTRRTRRPRPVRPGVGALFQAGMMTRGRRRFSPGRSRPEAVGEGCFARPLPRCPGSRPTGHRQ